MIYFGINLLCQKKNEHNNTVTIASLNTVNRSKTKSLKLKTSLCDTRCKQKVCKTKGMQNKAIEVKICVCNCLRGIQPRANGQCCMETPSCHMN